MPAREVSGASLLRALRALHMEASPDEVRQLLAVVVKYRRRKGDDPRDVAALERAAREVEYELLVEAADRALREYVAHHNVARIIDGRDQEVRDVRA